MARLSAFGSMLGALFMGLQTTFLHPDTALSHTPIAAAVLGGILDVVVLGGAATCRNRFARGMSKWVMEPSSSSRGLSKSLKQATPIRKLQE
jgi:hypothetical protein